MGHDAGAQAPPWPRLPQPVPPVWRHSAGPHCPVLGPVSRVRQADASSRHLASVGLLCSQTEGVKQGWGFSEMQRAVFMNVSRAAL